jgi:hypothetical protein
VDGARRRGGDGQLGAGTLVLEAIVTAVVQAIITPPVQASAQAVLEKARTVLDDWKARHHQPPHVRLDVSDDAADKSPSRV